MKQYEVKTKFVFEGIFRVKAKSRQEACEHIEKYCGLVMGGSIHTTLDEETVDWDFGIHPNTEIIDVKQIRKQNKK